METIFKIIGSLCTIAYILGVLSDVLNIDYTQKAVRLTFALFLVTNVFIPLDKIDLNLLEFNIPIKESNADIYVLQNAEQIIEKRISSQLDIKDIDYSDVDVHINKETDKVYIDYIKIYGASGETYQYIENMFEEGTIIFED